MQVTATEKITSILQVFSRLFQLEASILQEVSPPPAVAISLPIDSTGDTQGFGAQISIFTDAMRKETSSFRFSFRNSHLHRKLLRILP